MSVRDKIAKALAGIKAYHSSPHDFDRFDLSKIGTGEGAQVYGHGLYFAENPAVSGRGGQYWEQFVNKFGPEERRAAELLQKNNFDRDKALLQARKEARFGVGDDPFKGFYEPPDYGQVSKLLESGKPVGPRTYEVNINADPAHMLDWDKPLASHPEAVRESLLNTLEEGPFRRLPRDRVLENALEGIPGHPTGESFYRHLAERGASHVQPLVSERMLMNDIPGIKYLDQGSRSAGTGSSNYVVFDPSIIDITKKYAVPGALGAGAMGAVADQSQYEVMP